MAACIWAPTTARSTASDWRARTARNRRCASRNALSLAGDHPSHWMTCLTRVTAAFRRFLRGDAVLHCQTLEAAGIGLTACRPGARVAAIEGGIMNRTLASLTLIGLFLLCAGAPAQESASSGISGQVTDSTNGAMTGATVTVTNLATNAQREAVTDPEGRFTIPNLPPATYRIRIELTGFQTAEVPDLSLR